MTQDRGTADRADPGGAPFRSRPPRSGGIKIAMIIVAIVIVIATGLVWLGRSGGSPARAASVFFQINASDGPGSAYALTTTRFQEVTSQSVWSAVSDGYHLGDFSGAEWTQRSGNDQLTTVRGTLHLSGHPDLAVAVDLRSVDGKWHVSSLAIQPPAGQSPISGMSAAPPTATTNPSSVETSSDQEPAVNTPSGSDAIPTAGAPAPVMAVPPSSDNPGNTGPAQASPGGRAGPPGTAVASGQVGPECMNILWKVGVRTTNVDCPIYLPTRPGASEQCTGHLQSGGTTAVTVTFVDYDPQTRESRIDCRAG